MNFEDFIAFRAMITPVIIQGMFWVGVIVCVLVGLFTMFTQSPFMGLLLLLLGPIAVRVNCEIIILFFKMNETMTQIKNK